MVYEVRIYMRFFMNKIAIITGVSGQDGSYLSKILVDEGYSVIGLVRNKKTFSYKNLEYLSIANKVIIHEVSLLNFSDLFDVFKKYKPGKVFNFASQSSVASSYFKPKETLEFNIQSVVNLLDCIRLVDSSIKFFQASSSEIFGQPEFLPVNEETPINPNNLYAISKATTHEIINYYRLHYNLSVAIGIFLNHESVLRGNNFIVKKIIQDLYKIKHGKLDILRVGNIETKRDFGYAPKYMELVYKMTSEEAGDDFIVSTGSSIAIKDIIYYVLDKLNLEDSVIRVDQSLFRKNDVLDMYGDSNKAIKKFNWNYDEDFFDVLDEMMRYEEEYFYS
jgi:GDPmannose 4,6-dehydratase